MIIKKANLSLKKNAFLVAETLPEWFNKVGLKNMNVDFKYNSVVVATEYTKVIGFICYTTYSGKILLLWMGVKKEFQNKGVGSLLIQWLCDFAKNNQLNCIEVETLPEEIEYEPYNLTRQFYYKNGFKRILYKKSKINSEDDQIVLEKKL